MAGLDFPQTHPGTRGDRERERVSEEQVLGRRWSKKQAPGGALFWQVQGEPQHRALLG